jgi:hypothetical protein
VRPRPDGPPAPRSDDARWLLHFTLIALALGLVAILAIAVLTR